MQEHSHLFHLSSNRNWVAAVFSIQGRSYGVRIWSTKPSGKILSFSDMYIKIRRKAPYLHPMCFPYGVLHIVNVNKYTKSKNIIYWITINLFCYELQNLFSITLSLLEKEGGGRRNIKMFIFWSIPKGKNIYIYY